MPCFKGIAVSIHANGAPLPEYGLQKQSRVSRISNYIPVPQPQLNPDSNKPEAAKFAISITLLTPGLPIPYSTPKPTVDNPNPQPQIVGGHDDRGKAVSPYIAITASEHETIAAYIYFDGRAKEEVATLLRPGEETWVNSRWVQIPESEGGGLAEREFLFREVGLERWLNGLDLEGHDAAEKVEKRRQRFERRRRRQQTNDVIGMDVEKAKRDTLRYGGDEKSPVEAVFDDDDSASFSSDDEPPETAGQIKVAMFRVIASGEIRKGEYSPQFDAHDDDEEFTGGNQNGGNGSVDADVEHTTSFAKPKTLDPKTISTQTVTGIDGPEKPYAVFTFFYRGDRQLQRMGILPSSKAQQSNPIAAKRRSGQLDFSNLGPLKTSGTVGFSAFRDQNPESIRRRKSRKKSNGDIDAAMNGDSEESDDDDEVIGKMEDVNDKIKDHLSPEDAKFTGELADGVDRIRLKRQHSFEPDSAGGSSSRKSPSAGPFSGEVTPPESSVFGQAIPGAALGTIFGKSLPDEALVGSPLKKQRASADITANGDPSGRPSSFPPALGDVLAKAEAAQKEKEEKEKGPESQAIVKEEEEEEL